MQPMTTGMVSTVFMPQSSFSSILRLAYYSIFSILFETIFISFGIDTSINFNDLSFLSTITTSGLLLVICLSIWMSKSYNTLMTSFSMTGKGSWLYQATEVSSRREKELAILW